MLIGFCFVVQLTNAQHNLVSGLLREHANEQVWMNGFNGFETYSIDSVQVDSVGYFELSYSNEDQGMAILAAEGGAEILIVLDENEHVELEGNSLNSAEITFLKGPQNIQFDTYMQRHRKREAALDAWSYLAGLYEDPELHSNGDSRRFISDEIDRLAKQDSTLLAGIPSERFLSFYLPLRTLTASVHSVATRRTWQIPAVLNAFRSLDYSSSRLFKSGLLQETLDSHFWLLENSGNSLDQVYDEMRLSIDYMILNLQTDSVALNEITSYLFKYLEKRSLHQASEYLALQLLENNGCALESNLAARLEGYRAMKVGTKAPDILFQGDLISPVDLHANQVTKLSDIRSKYKLVIFGASWCPSCPQELQQITRLYPQLKSTGIEVVFISLDTNETTFNKFASIFPFYSTCDYQKWECQAAIDYHIYATPTMYLLDEGNEIILKPTSSFHVNAWIQHFLNQ